MFNNVKSMSFIRRLNKGNFYLSSQKYQIWWIISGIYVKVKYKISAQYLQNYVCLAKNTPGHGV